MERWIGKIAVVTGASSGIGAAVATQLVKNGLTVIGCSRNTAKIESLSQELSSESGKLIARRCDVRQEQEVKEVFQFARTQFGGVDVCVNNAGLAHKAPILSGNTEEWREMLEVNVLGVCVFTREFVTQLKERGVDQGHIININSVTGHKVASKIMYSASKHALTVVNEGVRRELREMKSNVKITSISPGLVKTEFRVRLDKREDVEKCIEEYDTLLPYGPALEAGDIASAVLYALSTPPRMEINEIIIRPIGQTF